jgi:hypothetical protein
VSIFRTARNIATLAGDASGRMVRPRLGIDWGFGPPLNPILPDVYRYGLVGAVPFGRTEAMSVPPIARARNLLAPTIARIPLRAYRGDEPIDPQPGWIGRTDTIQPAFQRMVWTVDDLIFFGESLWLCERGADGFPALADRVPYEDWQVDDDSRILVDGAPVDESAAIYIAGFHEGILNFAGRAIREAADLERSARDTARAPFKLELHQVSGDPLTGDEISELIGQARTAIADNQGVLYTNQAIQAIVHSYTAENLLTEGRNYAAVDMARIVGVPAATIDAVLSGSGITYQTGPMLNEALIDYGAAGYLSAISSRLCQNDVTPNGQTVAFDVEAFIGPVPTDTTAPAESAPPPPPPPATGSA